MTGISIRLGAHGLFRVLKVEAYEHTYKTTPQGRFLPRGNVDPTGDANHVKSTRSALQKFGKLRKQSFQVNLTSEGGVNDQVHADQRLSILILDAQPWSVLGVQFPVLSFGGVANSVSVAMGAPLWAPRHILGMQPWTNPWSPLNPVDWRVLVQPPAVAACGLPVKNWCRSTLYTVFMTGGIPPVIKTVHHLKGRREPSSLNKATRLVQQHMINLDDFDAVNFFGYLSFFPFCPYNFLIIVMSDSAVMDLTELEIIEANKKRSQYV
ncbi:uncharacterized protein PGTG_19309 [Puccinia graminis f. sp. tritici CRL 75-36-700-3]|uniref:Uncharacterized protein n=1 Tax=Puccinia graminis f. sp. tritici (strain CRL 75-36-700-3 / race SCCL) TaxID=418459 RepID=E3L9N7_PUCGT|nr:uncharacterized protein PGTG_19309 [Puccinia graminis f. sp. tritici CRL 75-36-700-3]EFP93262.1 hypothetical protein PGTG_19309 [Puccinia graminis f. sp. tritici CRL 75-36-700-3]